MRPDPAVQAAEREAADAQHDLDALTERVRNGDQDVTPKQLAAAQQVVDFAKLRIDAANRTAARLREDERQQLADHARQAATHLLSNDGSAEIVAATVAAAGAIAALRKAVDARNANLAAVGANISRVASSVIEEKGDISSPSQVTRPYGVWGDTRHVSVQGVGSASAYRAGHLAAGALLVGLGVDAASVGAWAEAKDLIAGLAGQAVNRLGLDVPGLADAWRLSPEEWASASQQGRYRAGEQGRRPLPAEQG